MSHDKSHGDFFAAVKNGDNARVSECLKGGVDPNTSDEFGRSALYLAALFGHADIVRALLAAGANVEFQVENDSESARVYGGADLNDRSQPPSFWNNDDFTLYTPMKVACRMGHVAAVQALIEAKADVEYGNSTQSTLYVACKYNQPEIAKLLITAGAQVNGKSNWLHSYAKSGAETPLVIAFRRGHQAVIDVLLAYGAPLAKLRAERLYQACKSKDREAVKAVLNEGHDPNEPTEEGYSPLLAACGTGRLEIVALLCAHGAWATTQAVERAIEGKQREITSLLVGRLKKKQSGAALKRIKAAAKKLGWVEVQQSIEERFVNG